MTLHPPVSVSRQACQAVSHDSPDDIPVNLTPVHEVQRPLCVLPVVELQVCEALWQACLLVHGDVHGSQHTVVPKDLLQVALGGVPGQVAHHQTG